jgi:uncharacterized membrane protein
MEPALILIALVVASLPFILPIVSLVRQSALRYRLDELQRALTDQQRTLDLLEQRLSQLTRQVADAAPRAAAPPTAERAAPPPATKEVVTPAAPVPRPAAPPPIVPTPPVPPPVVPRAAQQPPSAAAHPEPPPAPPPPPIPPRADMPPPRDIWRDMIAAPAALLEKVDWEQIVGVKLFSAVAAIALVLAAVFFLRYSLDRGWLAPVVRVAIGIVVGTALLVVCELRAAHRYRITANALDAAAVAILFSTFFAAHALWNLIPSPVTFGLLALVTVLAVLLSIRHDSLFIALLGLVGGFSTPALLSTGENRPIPLFVYLLLLNIGLAWVAVRKQWPVLTLLTLALTTIYQWGWVITFLSSSQLTLGMGIFLVFAVASFVALTLGRRGRGGSVESTLDASSLGASAMPLAFAIFLAAVPQYGVHAALLFGFLLLVVIGLTAVAIVQRDDRLHAIGATATLLVFAVWLATSYAASAWRLAIAFTVVFAIFFALAPMAAARAGRPFSSLGSRTIYAAPILLFVFPVIVGIEPAAASPLVPFAGLFVVLAVIAWRALALNEAGLYFVAAFFAVAAEASWSATHLVADRLGPAVALYSVFALFYLGVPAVWRRRGQEMQPRWGAGTLLIASLVLLHFLAAGSSAAAAVWGLALLLAILNAGLFIESAAGAMPMLSAAGAILSWIVLAVWWDRAAAAVGALPSLLVVTGLTLIMLGGHAWAHSTAERSRVQAASPIGFRHGIYLALVGQLFLAIAARSPQFSAPPWPLFGALLVMTLATTAAALNVAQPELHAAGVIAAAIVVLSLSQTSAAVWGSTALAAAEVVVAYAAGSLVLLTRVRQFPPLAPSAGAVAALFVAEACVTNAAHAAGASLLAPSIAAHVVNLSLILAIVWQRRWPWVAEAAVVPAWLAAATWQGDHPSAAAWKGALVLAAALYGVFVAYPFVLNRRARDSRHPSFTAVAGSVFFFFAARRAFLAGGLQGYVGIIPVAEGVVMALLLRQLLQAQPAHERDLGRLALVAASALSFATVAIPLQLSNQWITIGWALEGAALAWLYRRVPHKGLLYATAALLAVVFVRLALNPAVFVYEPRGSMRILNWYLYAYLTSAVAMLAAAWWLSKTDDRIAPSVPRTSSVVPALAVIVLFILLNIEVADFYATGPEITFRFGATLAQDLTYTLCWLVFGLGLLTAGIYLKNRYSRIAAVALIGVTASKAFLYDLGSLGGLYRVGSLVGLAVSLSLVALALQKFVLLAPREQQ